MAELKYRNSQKEAKFVHQFNNMFLIMTASDLLEKDTFKDEPLNEVLSSSMLVRSWLTYSKFYPLPKQEVTRGLKEFLQDIKRFLKVHLSRQLTNSKHKTNKLKNKEKKKSF